MEEQMIKFTQKLTKINDKMNYIGLEIKLFNIRLKENYHLFSYLDQENIINHSKYKTV